MFDKVNIDVVFLSYNSKRSAKNPSLEYKGTELAGQAELQLHQMQLHHNPNKHVIPQKQENWYNSILREILLNEVPSGYKLRLIFWKIESGSREAFHMQNMDFNEVTLIVGINTEYWYGVNTSPNTGYTHGFGNHSSDKLCPIIQSRCNLVNNGFNFCKCFAKLLPTGHNRSCILSELTSKKINEFSNIIVANSHNNASDEEDEEDSTVY